MAGNILKQGYLANLCRDCRACYYVCPFIPPHEFNLNFPQVMGKIREATYQELCWPAAIARRVDRSWLATGAVSAASLAVVAVAAGVLGGVEALTTAHVGDNSFYAVIPRAAMVIPAMVLAILATIVILAGAVRFWRQGTPVKRPRTLSAWLGAAKDAATLRNMRGDECSYPGEEHSNGRWIYHSLLFFGYCAALVSTTIAAFLGEILQVPPPYPLLSAPVVFGVAGGIGMIVGAAGLLWLKFQTQRDLSHPEMRSLDLALLVMTLAVAGSGMLVLGLRETALMPLMLVIHLGFVAALFATAPYGKLVHGVYRYLALVRDRFEQSQAARASGSGVSRRRPPGRGGRTRPARRGTRPPRAAPAARSKGPRATSPQS